MVTGRYKKREWGIGPVVGAAAHLKKMTDRRKVLTWEGVGIGGDSRKCENKKSGGKRVSMLVGTGDLLLILYK